MIEWRFTPDDVARIRLAYSPLWEIVLSLIALRAPAGHALHLPWVRWARPRLAGLDLTEVLALVPVHGTVADFLTPPPSSPLAEVVEELEVIRRTDPDRVVDDIAEVPGVSPAVRDRIAGDPAAAAARLADVLHTYWERVLAPHWPRMRALLDADVLWRARRLADGGARLLFADLHETLSWHGDRLTAEGRCDYSGGLSGTGLLLAPSAMVWPIVRTMLAPYQPTVIYPARAVGTLWEVGPPPTGGVLEGLLGRSRAAVLLALSEPASTTAMARSLGLTPGAVSQHLSILLANGLVTRARVGGSVLYHRTIRGDDFVTPSKSERV